MIQHTSRRSRPTQRRGVPLALVALLILASGLAACGSKETPMPAPATEVRAAPTDTQRPATPTMPPPTQAEPTASPVPPFVRRPAEVTILHTNDVYGEIDPCG